MSNIDRLQTTAQAAIRRKFIRHRIRFGALFTFVVIAAVLTPHIVDGHFIVPERFGQSAVILLDILVFLVILFFYQRETRKLTAERDAGERLLSDSYRYIGKANRTMDIISQFMNVAAGPVNKRKEKETFTHLLSVLLVTILKTERGLLRFVNRATERTVAEYNFSLSGDPFKAKIPNKVLFGEKYYEGIEGGVTIVTAGSQTCDIACSLCFAASGDIESDRKRLAATLLNQLLHIFLINRVFQDGAAGDWIERDAAVLTDEKAEVS